MARQRDRPVRLTFPQRVERAADSSGVWLDERLVRWSEFRAVGCVLTPTGAWDPGWREDDKDLYAALQLTDGTHAWTGLSLQLERVHVWLRRLVEPELPLRPFANNNELHDLAMEWSVLWPPHESGPMYDERRRRFRFWRTDWFARLR